MDVFMQMDKMDSHPQSDIQPSKHIDHDYPCISQKHEKACLYIDQDVDRSYNIGSCAVWVKTLDRSFCPTMIF